MTTGKCKLKEGCCVVAIEDGSMYDSDMADVERGMMFRYRGESPPGVHQFAPEPMVNGGVGFQIPDDDMMDDFYEYLRVLADDGTVD